MSAITPLAIIIVVYLLGLAALLWAAFVDGEGPSDEGGGGGGGGRGGPPDPPRRPTGGLPLAESAPSPVRLREPGRLGDLAPTWPVRRGPAPGHAPPARPIPERECARAGDRLR